MKMAGSSGPRGIFPELVQNYQGELETQDEYLHGLGLSHHEVYPDENSLFRAVRSSAKCFLSKKAWEGKEGHRKLRAATVEEIQFHLAEYKEFFHGASKKSMIDELDCIEEPGTWVGYESLMATSRVLNARILISYGGTDHCPDIITKAFYFGEEVPETFVHIIWVSLGYYDAVVPSSLAETRGINTFKYIQDNFAEEGLGALKERIPSHHCKCGSTCEWKRYKFDVNLKKDSDMDQITGDMSRCSTGGSVAAARQSRGSSNADSDEGEKQSEDDIWMDIFTDLRRSGPAIREWRMLSMRLKVPGDKLQDIESTNMKQSEKLVEVLQAWHQANGASSTAKIKFEALIKALRKERLNLVADNLERGHGKKFW